MIKKYCVFKYLILLISLSDIIPRVYQILKIIDSIKNKDDPEEEKMSINY